MPQGVIDELTFSSSDREPALERAALDVVAGGAAAVQAGAEVVAVECARAGRAVETRHRLVEGEDRVASQDDEVVAGEPFHFRPQLDAGDAVRRWIVVD